MTTATPTEEEVDDELVTISIPEAAGPVWVTPELARLWLTRNDQNRKIRDHLVNAMARDMATDHWAYTGEAIKFDRTGKLLDGQHRLKAVLKSGATVKMFVITDLPAEAQSFMDAGARRSAGDALAFREEVNATLLASTIRFAIRFDGKRTTKDPTSHAEIIAWLTENPEIRRYVGLTQRHFKKIDIKPSVFAYALWRLFAIDERDAQSFLNDIVEMRSTGLGDPINALLQRFRTARKNREKLDPVTELGFVFRVWNAYRTGASLKILKVPAGDWDVVVPR
jgi:hypothetical protein